MNYLQRYKPDGFGTYFEPFVGGGAFLLELTPEKAVINDRNSELVSAYRCLGNEELFNEMVRLCKEHESKHSKEYYFEVREMDRDPNFPSLPLPVRAARMLYLNKACFNGLYRVNGKGFFNVPFNGKTNVRCFDEDNIRQMHKYFMSSDVKVLNGDFADAVLTAKKGDFVYFDPPYDVLGEQSFTSYTKNGFGSDEQIRLRDLVVELTKRGVYVMLSNSNTEFIRDLYANFHVHIVEATRLINSKADGRGKVEEVLVTNYEPR